MYLNIWLKMCFAIQKTKDCIETTQANYKQNHSPFVVVMKFNNWIWVKKSCSGEILNLIIIFHTDNHFSLRGLNIPLNAVQVLLFKKWDVQFPTQLICLTVTYTLCFMISKVTIS